jgi:hypothetical protein
MINYAKRNFNEMFYQVDADSGQVFWSSAGGFLIQFQFHFVVQC